MPKPLKYLFAAFCTIILCVPISALNKIDSLKLKYASVQDDSSRVELLLQIAWAYNDAGVADTMALKASQAVLSIAQKYHTVNDNRKIHYASAEGDAYQRMGNYFKLKGNNKEALNEYLKALDIYEGIKNKAGLTEIYNVLSGFYRETMQNLQKAMEYSDRALEAAKELKDKTFTASALCNKGNVYYDMDSDKMALKYYLQSISIYDTLHFKGGNVADIENNIGSAYVNLNEYTKAIDYYQKALDFYLSRKDETGIAMCYGNIGNALDMDGQMEKGVQYSEQSLQIARKLKAKDLMAAAYSFLAEGYSKMGDYKKAFECQAALVGIKDSIFSEASTRQVNDMQVKYDTEKKEKENQILALSINKEKIINYSILAGLLLVIALAFFIYRSYRDKQKANDELAEKNKIIEEKNKDIVDSINYAQRIQRAILTSDEYLKEALGDYFVLYKPRDVVSGDFYWCYTNHHRVIFTVADCTGHGVPGAFMSMIGNSLLNEIVIEKKITEAADILNMLRTNLLRTLQQKGKGAVTRDGMDIALCIWDKNKNEIQYAGANNPLYVVRKNGKGHENNGKIKAHHSNFYEITADKKPIGYLEDLMDSPFTAHTIKLEPGDTVYITTDGYADQFGGETDKKFTKKRLRETFISIAHKQLHEQKEIMDSTIENWKKNNTQTDDICMIAVRIS